VFRETVISCLKCGSPMVDERFESGQAYEHCHGCGAAWMETPAFLSLLRHAHPSFAFDELMEHDDGSEHRPCPRCGERMAIVWIDLLQLDQCAAHGVWFDAGELGRALRGDVVPRIVGAPPPSSRRGPR
jgi:hypothetical protein